MEKKKRPREKEVSMRERVRISLSFCLALALLAGGCAPRVGGSDYDASGVRTAQSVTYGTVQSVRVVSIHDDSETTSTLSTAGGAVAGGVLGNLVGGGAGRTVATVGGALLGAAAGYGGSKALTSQEGYEIMVKLENGSVIAVTQGTDMQFTPGQRVKVLSGGGSTRVTPS
jgi:outer membrane lipoprotein SlyB